MDCFGGGGGGGGGGNSGGSGGRGGGVKGGRGAHPRAAEIESGMQLPEQRDLERAQAEYVECCGTFFVLGKLPLTTWLGGVLEKASPMRG